MKRLLLSALITLFTFSAMADELYNALFNVALKESVSSAKETLAEWEQKGPKDGDYYSAYFHLHMQQALAYGLKTSKYMPLYAADKHVQFKDSLGGISHYMYSEITIADSTQLDSAITWVKKGIEKFPNRLDLRLALPNTFRFLDDAGRAYIYMEEIVNWAIANPDSAWMWTSDEPVKKDDAPVEEYLQDFFSNCNSSTWHKDLAIKFVDLGLRLAPNDPMFWNDKAGLRIEAGDYQGALEIMEEAHKKNPDNKYISTNIERLKELMKEQ